MKFGNVEIPATLIDSLKHNRVIVFAGAGVSMATPANLPDFVTLTRKILNLDDNEKFDNPDQKLGEGFDQGVRIHEQCIRVLNQNSPQPTQLHHDILKLFPKKTRVITTNFDLLFEKAFFNLNPDGVIKKFNAPVFPLGSNIEGVIYLHGNVTDPSSMVLSDSDFGRAYLSESWAKRLLTDAFLNYDFIFIGYSYNDTILKYLTRSLPKNRASRLYAFANIEDGNTQQVNHWTSLGIEPLIYQKENGTHLQLPEAVEKIAHFLNLGFSDYGKFICSKVVEYEQNQFEDDLNYIKYFLGSNDSYKHFYRLARPEVWLFKIKEDQSLFDILMKREDDLFDWLRGSLETHTNELMDLLQKYPALKSNKNLLWVFFRTLDDLQDKNCYLKWFLFLESSLYQESGLWNGVISWVLKKLVSFGLVTEFTRAFSAYLKIEIKPKVRFGIERYDVDVLVKIVKENERFYETTLEVFFDKLSEYEKYIQLWEGGNKYRFIRKQEIWEKSKRHTDLIFHLVDSVVLLISENKLNVYFLDQYMKKCINSESVLLNRLGIYLMSYHCSSSADFIYSLISLKFDWFDIEYRSEFFKFFELNYSKLSAARRVEIINKIKSNVEFENYEKLKYFSWIYKFSPSCNLIKQEYDQLKILIPGFRLKDKPYLSWRSSGVYRVTYSSPFTMEEIEKRNDYIWYLALLEYNLSNNFSGPNQLSYKGLWSEIANTNIQWILEFLKFTVQIMPEHPIVEKIIRKAKDWQFDKGIHEKFIAICQLVIIRQERSQIYAISQFLSDIYEVVYYQSDTIQYLSWVNTAKKILDLNDGHESFAPDNIDGFTESLNSVNGSLACFITKLYELSKDDEEVQKSCEIFIKLLIDKDENGYALIRLLNFYSFIKGRNSLFAQKELLPYLFSEKKKIKLSAWKGFLSNDCLEFAEFREIRKEFFSILQYALDHNDKQLIQDLTDLYIYSIYFEYHEDATQSLRNLQRFENQFIAEQVLVTLRRILSKENDVDKIWVWLGEYIQDRLYQVNQILNKDEISNIWYLLTDQPQIIVKLKDIVLQLPFKDEWASFLPDLSRNHVDIFLGHEVLWCKVLGFYLDHQVDRIAGLLYEDEINLFRSLIPYDHDEILQTALTKKGIRL